MQYSARFPEVTAYGHGRTASAYVFTHPPRPPVPLAEPARWGRLLSAVWRCSLRMQLRSKWSGGSSAVSNKNEIDHAPP